MHPLLMPLMLVGAKAGVTETVALSGTQGSPILRTYIDIAQGEVNIFFTVAASDTGGPSNIDKGNVESAGFPTSQQAVYTGINTTTTWINVKNYTGTYWVRFTLDSGDAVNASGSSAFDTWLSLDSGNKFFGWTTSSVVAVREGVVKVEIADNTPQDSNIVATGYYKGRCRAQSGA